MAAVNGLGMVGLGRMGGNMVARLRSGGHRVVGYDRFSADSEVPDLAGLVAELSAPRIVWVMVPAGDPTESTVVELSELLDEGDMVVDGGNSRFSDSIRRSGMLAESGIGFVDAGVSGGIWGKENGYALMVGGSSQWVEMIWPFLTTLAPESASTPGDGRGLAHVGEAGAGHFTKMVHNGIEYAIMQAFGEGLELMSRHEVQVDVPAALRSWQEGSVVRSWLLDLLVRGLDLHPGLEDLSDFASDSGEGRWTVNAAVDAGVAVPTISSALFARFVSQADQSLALKAVAALREQFGGHAVTKADAPGPAPTDGIDSGS